jgi:hypothetical protein
MNSMPMWHTRRGAGAATPYAAGEEPLRAELLNAEQMEERGRELAAEHKARASRSTANPLLHRLSQNADVIRECCRTLAEAIKENQKVTPAGEWLLDNLYLIDEQIRTARRHLPRRYSLQLPVLAKGASAGLPRVYDIALKAISHGDGRFDEDSLRRFVAAYQEVTPLTIGELWAIPIVLRLALIENLRRVAYSVRVDRIDRNIAIRWADAMIEIARRDPTGLILVAADMAREQPPMSSSFVSELSRRLQPLGDAVSLPMTWIDQRLAEAGLTGDQLVQSAQREQAADQVSVSNCIGSLRLLDALDWKTFFESVSVVETILREDPAGAYAKLNFATRDMYRHVVEKLAREAELGEPEIASTARNLAAEAPSEPSIARHVGYWLVDDGYAALRARCNVSRRPPLFDPARAGHVPFAVYFVAIVVLGAVLMVPTLPHLTELPTAWAIAAAFFAAIAISQLAVSLVNRASALAILPRRLPEMDFRLGIPAEAKTLVVVPTLLTSADRARKLVDDLEIRYLANRDANLAFARAAGTSAKTRGWARNESAASSPISMRCYAATAPTASPRLSVTSTRSRRRATSSRSTATRSCRATPPVISSRRWSIRSTGRVSMPRAISSPAATRSCSRASAACFRSAARRRTRISSAAMPASIPTRARSPTRTRIFSPKARSSARASTMSMRSSASSPTVFRTTAS